MKCVVCLAFFFPYPSHPKTGAMGRGRMIKRKIIKSRKEFRISKTWALNAAGPFGYSFIAQAEQTNLAALRDRCTIPRGQFIEGSRNDALQSGSFRFRWNQQDPRSNQRAYKSIFGSAKTHSHINGSPFYSHSLQPPSFISSRNVLISRRANMPFCSASQYFSPLARW